MKPEAEITSEMRRLYKLIYKWHSIRGKAAYLELYPDSSETRGELLQEYIHLVDVMPRPGNATPDQMAKIANAVLCGCMEWSCGTRVGDSSMSRIAKRIMEQFAVFQNHQEQKKNEAAWDDLKTLRNHSTEPRILRIKTPDGLATSDTYVSLADVAYSDVPNGLDNIGGAVVLADTNRQCEDFVQRDGENMILVFRNAATMHLEVVKALDSLVVLVQSGTLSILSVTIGE